MYFSVVPGYTGADCSVVEGHPPGLLALLPSNVCDIQTKPCQKIRLHVSGIMDSESLTCRVKKLKVSKLYSQYVIWPRSRNVRHFSHTKINQTIIRGGPTYRRRFLQLRGTQFGSLANIYMHMAPGRR